MWRAAVLALGAVACGHRVAEPDRAGQAAHTVAITASSAAAASATATVTPAATVSARPSASASFPLGRCIFRTPEKPSRPAPPRGPDPRCPADPTGPPKLRHATVRVAGLDATVAVEVAERDLDRQRGLMYRTKLPETEGMLFIFEDERDRAFWMRNTCLPLDMLFVASDGLIVGIEENVPTLNDDNYQPGECEARYVLEVNAGWARRHGVKAGQKLVFDGI